MGTIFRLPDIAEFISEAREAAEHWLAARRRKDAERLLAAAAEQRAS
jgi:ketosteroid isomerase-like protein